MVDVNGVEVGLSSLLGGTIGHPTYAANASNVPQVLASPVAIAGSSGLLQPSANLTTTELGSNRRRPPSDSLEPTAAATNDVVP